MLYRGPATSSEEKRTPLKREEKLPLINDYVNKLDVERCMDKITHKTQSDKTLCGSSDIQIHAMIFTKQIIGGGRIREPYAEENNQEIYLQNRE